MKRVKINITTPLMPAEIFFLEKSAELLNKETIDTYRLRINNPKTLLQELVQVISLIENKTLGKDYGHMLIQETLDVLKDEQVFNFGSINKQYILKVLGSGDLSKIYYAANVLLTDNFNYAERLWSKINDEIIRINAIANFDPQEFDELNKLIGFFYIELKAKGYSKTYLHNFIRAIFSFKTPHADFNAVMAIIASLIARQKEQFSIYLAFIVPSSANNQLEIASPGFSKVGYAALKQEAESINVVFKKFVEKYKSYDYYKIEVEAFDYHSAAYLAKIKMQNGLDLIFMGHSSQMIKAISNCFIVGSNDPTKGKRYNLDYQLDGYFASDQTLYLQFLNKIQELDQKNIDPVSKRKLISSLRYLRLGTIAEELENKLLNYWIAIEYLFSSLDTEEGKVKRLREYYKNIHAISYATKLFKYTQKSIHNLGLQGNLSLYNVDNLEYIINDTTLNELATQSHAYPLIGYRVYNLAKRFKDVDAIKKEFSRHQNNIERNIVRIYRSRNEIVHAASYEKNIIDITSHLRYYLTFIINGFLDFSIKNPIDANNDGDISIDDYFLTISVQLESLFLDKNLNIVKLLEFKDPIEYLT